MNPSPLINPEDLADRLRVGTEKILICDCSFDLSDAEAGLFAHEGARLPGAVYLDLDTDLSAPKTGSNGRHPLPTREDFAETMAAKGAGNDMLIVAYDSSFGMYAARLWWMLRWAGHERAAVLDGGMAAWRDIRGAVDSGDPRRPPRGDFGLRPPRVESIDYAALARSLGKAPQIIVDARAPDRFRGENETLDPVAGHIPGARHRFFKDNLDAKGRFKSAEVLLAEWKALLGSTAPADVIQQCGSGVTACHNLLAMEHAGLSGSRLYPGSWSEWCAQPDSPVALGD